LFTPEFGRQPHGERRLQVARENGRGRSGGGRCGQLRQRVVPGAQHRVCPLPVVNLQSKILPFCKREAQPLCRSSTCSRPSITFRWWDVVDLG